MSAFKDSGHHWWQQCQRCRMAWFIGDKPEDVDTDVTCAKCDAEDLRVIEAEARGFARARELAAQALEDKQQTCELLERQWRDAVDVANRNAHEATVATAAAFGRAKAEAEAVVRRHAERGRWYLEDVANDIRAMKWG